MAPKAAKKDARQDEAEDKVSRPDKAEFDAESKSITDEIGKAAVAAADSPGAIKARLKCIEAEFEEARLQIIALQHQVRVLDEQLAWEKHSGLQLRRELELEREKVRSWSWSGSWNWWRD